MDTTLPRPCLKVIAHVRARGAADLLALASVAAVSLAASATIAYSLLG
jgi:hypothetical protein